MSDFSFILLTYNEALHLPRFFESIKCLNAPVYILDSGSTDGTLELAKGFGAITAFHPFENHPRQWHKALNTFPVKTTWTIGLDADQWLSEELFGMLRQFQSESIQPDVNGIYFNRKFYFRGQWIRHGGYFPRYLLKMFRTGIGFSDLNENMDHRFVVPGKTLIWRKGYLMEENFKENDLSFWISKHNQYSTRAAEEEIGRRNYERQQTVRAKFWGSPDQRIAFYKKIWWQMPLFWRPFLYFFYRFILQLGILDGRQGRLFHFLHAFWFRLVVDEKISEILNQKSQTS